MWFLLLFVWVFGSAGNLAATPLVNDGIVAGSIDAPGERDEFTFDVNAGEAAHIRVAKTSGTLAPRVWLYNPDGTLNRTTWASTVAALDCFSTSSTCKLNQTGTYRLVVMDYYENRTGNYEIHYARVSQSNVVDVSGFSAKDSIAPPASPDGPSNSTALTDVMLTNNIQKARTAASIRKNIPAGTFHESTVCKVLFCETVRVGVDVLGNVYVKKTKDYGIALGGGVQSGKSGSAAVVGVTRSVNASADIGFLGLGGGAELDGFSIVGASAGVAAPLGLAHLDIASDGSQLIPDHELSGGLSFILGLTMFRRSEVTMLGY